MLTYQQKKFSIICVTVLAILAILYGSVFIIFKAYFNKNHIQELVITQAKKALNRDVSVSNDIKFKINWDLSPHITLNNVSIANASWAKNRNMAKVAKLDIHFSLTKLIFNEFHIISLSLQKPEIYLETKGGKNNWTFNEDVEKDSNLKFSIHNIKITQGLLVYNDETITIDKLLLKVENDETDYNLQLSGKYNHLPLKTTLNFETTSKEAELEIKNLVLGNSTIKGALKVKHDSKEVTGDFEANTLILDDFIGGEDTASGEYSLPTEKIPLATLRDSEFKFKIKINKLNIDGLIFSNVNLVADSNNNVLNFKLNPAAKFANGTFDFKLAYDMRPKNPLVKINAQTNNLTLEGLLDSLYGKSPIQGSDFKFSAELASSGDNMQNIVGNLHGKMLFTASEGNFLNGTSSLGNVINSVITSLISFDKTKSITEFKCGVLNFKVNNGVANAKNAVGIEAASVNILGNGMVDLRNGRINFSMTPQNLITNPLDLSNFNLAQYVSVTGTLSKPQITVDPTKLITPQNVLMATGIAAGGIPVIAGLLAGNVATSGASNSSVSPCKAAMQNN